MQKPCRSLVYERLGSIFIPHERPALSEVWWRFKVTYSKFYLLTNALVIFESELTLTKKIIDWKCVFIMPNPRGKIHRLYLTTTTTTQAMKIKYDHSASRRREIEESSLVFEKGLSGRKIDQIPFFFRDFYCCTCFLHISQCGTSFQAASNHGHEL